MFFMPFSILGTWLRTLLNLALIGAGIYLLVLWYNNREVVIREPADPVQVDAPLPGEQPGANPEPIPRQEKVRVVRWEFGLNRETAFLLGGLALLGWSFGGGWLLSPRLLRKPEANGPGIEGDRHSLFVRRPGRPDLRVRIHGPADGLPVVFVHGWGLTSDEWFYANRELADRYRVITWDLPGLGASHQPADRDWSLDEMARDLDDVLSLAGAPAVLVGHSIGGMIILTYCKRFPEALGDKVRGLVLVHTTYTNPVKTTAWAPFYTALQKPVLEPLCHLMIWLSPLLRVMNWMSYVNGSAHRSSERSSFTGNETRNQLDHITKLMAKARPAVLAHGFLGMFRYDATTILRTINVPTLVVAAGRDRLCLPEASRFMADSIPDARLITLPSARHCGLFEFHDQFHLAVTEFLDAVGSTSPRKGGRSKKAPAADLPG